jgi:hypothetical protein
LLPWDAADSLGTDAVDFPPRILNITVPHVGHFPLMAFRPFFIVSSTASIISFFALHLTQYPSGIKNLLPDASCIMAVTRSSLLVEDPYRQLVKGQDSKQAHLNMLEIACVNN